MDLNTVDRVLVPRSRAELSLGLGDVPLAGGTWLYSEPQPAASGLVDLTGLDWPALEADADADADAERLTIGATCSIADLRRFAVSSASPGLAIAAACTDSLVSSRKIQETATVGGNVALALPAGSLTSLAVTLDAVAVIWLPDGADRRMPVADLVLGTRRTALRAGEVLRSLVIDAAALASRTAFRRIALSPLGRTGTLVTGRLAPDAATSIVVTGGVDRPVVLRFDGPPRVDEAREAVAAIEDWYDDPHGAPDWRRAMSIRFAGEIAAELAAPFATTERAA